VLKAFHLAISGRDTPLPPRTSRCWCPFSAEVLLLSCRPHVADLDQRVRPACADPTMSPAGVRAWGSNPPISLRDPSPDRVATLPGGSVCRMVRAWARADPGAGWGRVGADDSGDWRSEV